MPPASSSSSSPLALPTRTPEVPLRTYAAYGRTLLSELALPELEPASGPPDIVIARATAPIDLDPAASQPLVNEAGDVWLVVGRHEGSTVLSFPGTATFVVDLAAGRITCHPDPGGAGSEHGGVRHALLDQVIPRLLTATGSTVLHASGVVVDTHAVLFAGGSGAGKSTLAARCAGLGHRLLGDDAMVLEAVGGRWNVRAGYPGLRLWQDSIDMLDEAVEGRRLAPTSQKWRVEVPPRPDAAGPIATSGDGLAAIVMIERRPGPTEGRRLTGAQAFSRLWETTFAWPDRLIDTDLLDRVSALAAGVPILSVGFADGAPVAEILEAAGRLSAAG